MQSEEAFSIVPEKGKQEEETLWQRYGAERGVWSERMLVALENGVKGNQWFSLIDKVYADKTLELAWEKVKSNAGSCGIDGITVSHFSKDSQSRLLAVKEQLRKGEYQPSAAKREWIPKPGSAEKRPLGIPIVKDRVVEAALKMVIEPIFEREFASQSYGFRPGRSCKDALGRVEKLLKSGYTQVMDVDIKGYFDSIPHEKLMERVAERIADGRVLQLIDQMLKRGIMEEINKWEPTEEGTPQGGVISPLLANIYLNPLDWKLSETGIEMVRYADDIVVLCKSREEATKAKELVKNWMEENGLKLHPEKTRMVNMDEPGEYIDFLGYRFRRTNKGRLARLVRPKSLKRLRGKLKELTKRTNGNSMEAIIKRINRVTKGWFNYFKQANAAEHLKIDEWLRGRLRTILKRRDHREGRAGGRDHPRWPNRYFEQLGYFSLKTARDLLKTNLRHGVTC